MYMFNQMKAGMRIELANGLKATVTEVFKKTFLAKPDGGKHRVREYDFEGKTVDSAFDLKALLAERIDGAMTWDFGYGPVSAHYHINPDGTKGGIVADTAYVCALSRVGIGSVVFGDAQVINSEIKGNSIIGGGTFEGVVLDGQRVAGRMAA
jgi:hypothetical protein